MRCIPPRHLRFNVLFNCTVFPWPYLCKFGKGVLVVSYLTIRISTSQQSPFITVRVLNCLIIIFFGQNVNLIRSLELRAENHNPGNLSLVAPLLGTFLDLMKSRLKHQNSTRCTKAKSISINKSSFLQ